MAYKIGDRVGAIESADKNSVRLFGYGTYQGSQIPPDDVVGPLCHPGLFKLQNPCILLDSGETVWGCESWWGDEGKIKETIGGREVVIVKPTTRTAPTEAERAEAAAIIAEAKSEAAAIIAEAKSAIAEAESAISSLTGRADEE
jgi:hypothetical protein